MLLSGQAFAQHNVTLIYEGYYQGKNLYIQNPPDGKGVGFCVIEIYVNDSLYNHKIKVSAFEIDLSSFELGDKIHVKIVHQNDCLPKVLNPEPISRKCTFETTQIKVIEDSLLWTTTDEESRLMFVIEQYRWNKWIKIGESEGSGSNNHENTYSFPVQLHFGENKFRVKQIDFSGKPCISPIAEINYENAKVSFEIDYNQMLIRFSESTMFELFDTDGNIVKKGSGIEIDCSNLTKRNTYWLNFGHITGQKVSFKK